MDGLRIGVVHFLLAIPEIISGCSYITEKTRHAQQIGASLGSSVRYSVAASH
jgi:hypothetical protein